MNQIFLVGILAATLTTLSFLPQVIKTFKTRHTKDLSLGMLVIFALGLVLWTVYGVMLKELPIILANTVTLMLVSYILAIKLKNG